MGPQNRITEPCDLLDANGHLIHPGYATRPLWRYDRKKIKAPRHRIKEWDYYYALALEQGELKGDILLTRAGDDDMVIATSWKENPKAFYYNHKINGMDAEGIPMGLINKR